MTIRFLIFSCFFLLLLSGCEEKQPAQQSNIQKDSTGIHYTENIVPIDNEYTKIKNQFCEHVEFSDLIYTNANTKIYSLDKYDTTRRFIFMTEVECGYPAGNCGASIDVIIRKMKKYESQLKVCGTLDTVNICNNYFEYTTFTNRKLQVDIRNDAIKLKVISINNMPFDDLNTITNELDLLEGDLISPNDKSENLDAIVVQHKMISMNDGSVVHSYELTKDQSDYHYLFLHNENRQLQKLGGEGHFKIDSQKYYPQLSFHTRNNVEVWKYNQHKKIFSIMK